MHASTAAPCALFTRLVLARNPAANATQSLSLIPDR